MILAEEMPMKNPTATTHNKEELDKIIETHQPQLKAFVNKHVDNKADADDVVQDVFYQLLKTVETALSPIEHVSAWLYKVARNTIINRGKKKQEVEMPITPGTDADDEVWSDFAEVLFNDEAAPSPETEYLRSLVWVELEAALAELPPEQREVFELTELEGIPIKDISATLGVPVNTLLSRKHYAVKLLRKRLADLYNDLIFS